MTRSDRSWKLGLASVLAIGYAIAFCGESVLAQITPDTTLGSENSTVTSAGSVDSISGGAIRGVNLFHSFGEFNIDEGRAAVFTNPVGIENILTRVTGANPSNLLGTLGVAGNANLFLLNPNGIIFGSNARLDIGGSFVASTASSLNFAGGTQFSATAPQTVPLLTVSVSLGLQFGEGAGRILNQSVVDDSDGVPVGLQVPSGKTLALVGGDVALEGGNLTAEAGRIELGSVASSSFVSLTPTDRGFALGYEGVQNFRDIELSQAAYVEASGESGGNVQVQGKRVTLTDGSGITASTGSRSGGNLTVNASDSVELSGSANSENFSSLITDTFGSGTAGNISIATKRLIVNGGAYISAITYNSGQGGNLIVNASDSVELSEVLETPDGQQFPSGLFTRTNSAGNAGNVRITTQKLTVKNGAQVTASTTIGSQGKGGNLTVNASNSIELSGTAPNPENPSGLFARSRGSGEAGNLTITTGQLIVRGRAQITVSGVETGNAGNLDVKANNILLDNQGAILADTAFGEGGNIKLQAQDFLLLRGDSNISTTAGNQGGSGNGGNITINAGTLVGLKNSDITANALEGKGGLIQIKAQGILGLEVREQLSDNSSDITAFSQQSPELSGEVEIDTLNTDFSRGLVSLPTQPIDTQIVQACTPGRSQASSEFVVTGRGGLPPTPAEALSSDSIQVDWVTLNPKSINRHSLDVSHNTNKRESKPIVEAQGWVFGNNGEVMLTATPTGSFHTPWVTESNCYAYKNS